MGVIGELVDRSSDEVWRIEDENGREMAGAEAPDAGAGLPVDGRIGVQWSRGPEYFRRSQAPKPEGSFSTRSDSKRSSVNQVSQLLSSSAAVTPHFAYHC
jgi:hypothetical protein